MNKPLAIGLALVAITSIFWWNRTPKPAADVQRPTPASAAALHTQPHPSPVRSTPPPPQYPPQPPPSPQNLEPQPRLNALLHQLAQLYEPQGKLTPSELTALQAARQQAQTNLVHHAATLGPGGAREIARLYHQQPLRDRLLLLEGLGSINDPEAVTVLTELFATQASNHFHEQKQTIAALSQRPEPQATDALAHIILNNPSEALRFAAVQGLENRTDALPALNLIILGGENQAVRAEAVQSVGKAGTEPARSILAHAALNHTIPPEIRLSAIQQLRRSFGSAALPTLQSLQNDPNPAIRRTASNAIQLLDNAKVNP